ncbi:Pre-mRNA splicing factor-domain-containing protein [Cladorrhinum samala]|uniref:Pre-mRNA splicing factor-domain-containing protein n=1 Tax=Cladorrhinum samala TaxID=585594 RepID=A0AAV9HB93_9PEZI|nr:Pre-mRNA splicing factor-domain-containing protein [Cladorrhinum samala]
MGSGDLNMKKSWHPQRSGNVAATHKAEAEAIAERKKLQQRLQEIEEERRKEEIQKALEAAGGKRKIDRVEWMYSGPTDGQAGDAAESEAYLLGKRRIDKLLQDNEVKKLSKQATQEELAVASATANTRDVAAKIREDPLLAIKRQEQQAYEAMMNDPIKRRQLLASMGIEDEQTKSKAKEERRHRHRSHHHRSHRHRDGSRGDDRHSRRRRSDSRDRSRSPRRYDSEGEERRRRRRDSPDRRRYSSDSENSRERGTKRSNQERGNNTHVRRDRQGKRDQSREGPRRDDRSRNGSSSASPPPRKKDHSPSRRRDASRERGEARREHFEERRGGRNDPYRSQQDSRNRNVARNGNQDRAPPRDYTARRQNNGDAGRENAEQERARKLAAMQDAASDLDKAREQRLAAIADQERRNQELDERARQRNKRFGGDAGFTNQLHSRAAELKVADRMERR